jgi:tRNA (cmo5U34)-methyltransferase
MENWSLWQDESVVASFMQQRGGGTPHEAAQAEVLLRLLRMGREGVATFLDVGCGDGRLAELALRAYPEARAIGIDGSEAMLARGRERLASWQSRIDLRRADLEDDGWHSGLPMPFDAVLSGYAIHHLEDADKRRVYTEIHDLLRSGGVFIHCEHVTSASPLGEALFEEIYVDHATGQPVNAGVDHETLHRNYRARPDRLANRLTPLETQLQWLREIGYTDVDCYWKYSELCIFAGWRQHP